MSTGDWRFALVPLIVLPLVFGTIWLLVVTIVGWASGWRRLEARFPDRSDETLATFRMASAIMGASARLNNVLTVTACRDGLRVAISPLLGPKNRPFFVPWTEIRVHRARLILEEIAILQLGSPPAGTMKIRVKLADALASAAGGRWPETAAAQNAPIIR